MDRDVEMKSTGKKNPWRQLDGRKPTVESGREMPPFLRPLPLPAPFFPFFNWGRRVHLIVASRAGAVGRRAGAGGAPARKRRRRRTL
jgi:hypothetical protein